jgi:hypothetical protein
MVQPLYTHQQWAPPSVSHQPDHSHHPFQQPSYNHGYGPATNSEPIPTATKSQQPSLSRFTTYPPIESQGYQLRGSQYSSESSSDQTASAHSPWLLTPQYAFFPTTAPTSFTPSQPAYCPPYHLRQYPQAPFPYPFPYPYPTPRPINTHPNATANQANADGSGNGNNKHHGLETESETQNEKETCNPPLAPSTHVSSSWPTFIPHHQTQQHEANSLYHVTPSSTSDGYNIQPLPPTSHPFGIAPPYHPYPYPDFNPNSNQSNSINIPTGTKVDQYQHIFRSEIPMNIEPSTKIDPSHLFSRSGVPPDPTAEGGGTMSDRIISTNLVPSASLTPITAGSHSTRVQQYSHPAPLPTSDGNDGQKTSAVKRGRRSSVSLSRSRTTPLRKKRPPKLHLPPPTTNMHLPIPPPLHPAPAAAFSLDVLMPTSGRLNSALPMVLPQQPPKVNGWISPEERPVPPVGYASSVPQPSLQDDQAGFFGPGLGSNITPAPQSISQVVAEPSLRIATQIEYPAPPPYFVAPGLNGFEIIPWRAPRTVPAPLQLAQSNHIFPSVPPPPATAALWDLSAPPRDPLPPPSASSSSSTDSWSDMAPSSAVIPHKNEGVMVVQQSEPVTSRPLQRRTTSAKHAGPQSASIDNRGLTICEVCHTALSRQSDLVVSRS